MTPIPCFFIHVISVSHQVFLVSSMLCDIAVSFSRAESRKARCVARAQTCGAGAANSAGGDGAPLLRPSVLSASLRRLLVVGRCKLTLE